jgi:hypothetical protein
MANNTELFADYGPDRLVKQFQRVLACQRAYPAKSSSTHAKRI